LKEVDGVVRWEGVDGLTFVPDFLMDDPEKTRAGLKAAYRRLLDELEFEHLLLAHGEPVIGTAREELAALVGASRFAQPSSRRLDRTWPSEPRPEEVFATQ
jgi:hypothetical protein